jgi:hypothetical protein
MAYNQTTGNTTTEEAQKLLFNCVKKMTLRKDNDIKEV